MYCYLCENEYVGIRNTWCAECRKIKNLMNVYGRDRILTILETCCLRNPEQLENKIMKQKKKEESDSQTDESYMKPSDYKKKLRATAN
jgi:hypothetical protein